MEKDTKSIIGSQIVNIIEQLFPYDYSISGNAIYNSISVYQSLLDFNAEFYPTGASINKWTIPPGWKCENAYIRSGSSEYNCMEISSLGCAYLSPSYSGICNYQELLKHVATRQDLPDAIVYDWTRLYRVADRKKWGLSIPYTYLTSLSKKSSNIQVDIKTSCYDSTMPVLSFTVHGQSPTTFIYNAHNCHPFQANDDISGVAVLIRLFQELAGRENTKYTYTLLIGPELFAPMFWLADRKEHISNINGAILLKSVGNFSVLNMQHSYSAESIVDRIVSHACNHSKEAVSFHPFRQYYGNDETVFEAPGYGIPSVTLTRYPFPEYHTHLDTPDLISKESLESTYNVLLDSIDVLETFQKPESILPGLHCLSNPEYDLYLPAASPGIDKKGNSENEKRWNLLMNCLPMDLHRQLNTFQIAEKYSLPHRDVVHYIQRWADSGLVSFSSNSMIFS